MWPKKYKDYQEDEPLIREQVESGKGIIGCEMHELNGWGETIHWRKRRPNVFTKIFSYLSNSEKETLR